MPPRRAVKRPLAVIYLTGYGRSGSTVVGKMLGELDGAVYVGEINFFWADGVLGARPCGCGHVMSDCALWSAVIKRLGDDPRATAGEVVQLMAETTRLRHGFERLSSRGRRRLASKTAALAAHLSLLYRAIADEFDADVIIDSSKSPMYRAVLDGAAGLSVETVHLTRDPRAVADSWRRPKHEPVGSWVLPRIGLASSAIQWLVVNLLAARRTAATPPYVRLRYEDMMADPAAQIALVCDTLGRSHDGVGIDSDNSVTLGMSHSVAGNPNRFDTGKVLLRCDEGWRTRISSSDHRMITILTLPALRRFGYPVRRAGAGRESRVATVPN